MVLSICVSCPNYSTVFRPLINAVRGLEMKSENGRVNDAFLEPTKSGIESQSETNLVVLETSLNTTELQGSKV